MSAAPVLAVVLAFGVGAGAYLWYERLGRAGAGLALLRGTAGALLGLLILDLTCARVGGAGRPLVLLDGSLSMAAAGGRGAEARDSAQRWGELRFFGADPTGPDSAPGFGRSTLRAGLIAAAAQDRPVIVVSDGAVSDAGEIPADLLAKASVRLFPRNETADAAVLRAEAPAQVALDDTLTLRVTVGRNGPIARTGELDILSDGSSVLGTTQRLDGEVVEHTFRIPARRLGAGEHLLAARVTVAGDAEPRDDLRELLVHVTPLPGVVLLAAPPDWDGRQLYTTLRDVASLPVRGFVHLGAAGWRSMDGLRPVDEGSVARAAAGADLLVVKGAPEGMVRRVHPRGIWWWPSGEGGESSIEGDWYAMPPEGISPLSGALSGVPAESLPPLARLTPITPEPGAWVGLSALLGRRGAARPVIVGRDSAGIRTVTVAADGLWQWGFHPGASEEAYRQLVAATADWLLGGADTASGAARPLRRVVPLGAPIVFQRGDSSASGTLAVTWSGDSLHREDTLRFDGAGQGEARLPPGRYSYRFAQGGHGVVAVEPWSEEFVPRPPRLAAHEAAGGNRVARNALRDAWWVYALIVALLSTEWWLRRRMGLR